MTIRKAKVSDVPGIYAMLNLYAEQGLLLPRSLSQLYDVVRSFHVACPEDRPEVMAGVCALQVCWEDLGEIRSLAVSPDYRGTNIGASLIDVCQADALELGLKRLFVLTYIPKYFERFGYSLIDKSELPHKIWADCIKCVKFPECGEIALEKKL